MIPSTHYSLPSSIILLNLLKNLLQSPPEHPGGDDERDGVEEEDRQNHPPDRAEIPAGNDQLAGGLDSIGHRVELCGVAQPARHLVERRQGRADEEDRQADKGGDGEEVGMVTDDEGQHDRESRDTRSEQRADQQADDDTG